MSSKIGAKFVRRTDVRMTGWFVLAFSASALIICVFLYVRLKHQLIKEVDRFILDETRELTAILSRKQAEIDFLMKFKDETMTRRFYPFFFQILDKDGRSLYHSKGFREIGYEPGGSLLSNARNGKETLESVHSPGRRRAFRIISTPLLKDGKLSYIIQLGTHLRFVRKSLSVFKWNILAAFPIILALGSLGGWILARKSLLPIGYIASKTQSITSHSLSERLAPRGTNDEMDGLITTINGMIGRLEDSFNRLAEFTADASHELKTPLCAMRGEAEVLLSKERTAEEYQEGLAHFIERFDHLNQMINDLISLSKSDSSQIELKMVPIRLDLLIEEVCDLFKVLADQQGIGFSFDTMEEARVVGDPARLQQLFANLIDNAIKYTEKGDVRVTLEKSHGAVITRISDTGIGILKEEHAHIFKRFYRVEKSRSKETGGVGLGLSIAQWVVHAHRGTIEIASEFSKGSTFKVTLPASEAYFPP
jgi:heavy metal sensor kinase